MSEQMQTEVKDIEISHRQEAILGMVELCTFLMENPSLPVPIVFKGYSALCAFVDNKEELSAAGRVLVPFEKKYDSGYMRLERRFRRVRFQVIASRSDVCERVVVGKKTVPSQYIPEHEEEIVEWECEDPLLREEPANAVERE